MPNGHCGKKIDQKVKLKAFELFKQSLSATQISKRLGISASTVRKWKSESEQAPVAGRRSGE